MNDLSHSGSTRNKEQSALLLACLIATAPRFLIPYSEPLIHILLPRIRQALPASLRASLTVTSFSRLQNSTFTNNKGKIVINNSSSIKFIILNKYYFHNCFFKKITLENL